LEVFEYKDVTISARFDSPSLMFLESFAMNAAKTQPNKIFMGPPASASVEERIRIGDVVTCRAADGEDLPDSGTVIAIRSHRGAPESAEIVVQVGPNLVGVYLIDQLVKRPQAETSTHSRR
jgi:hypothetical protein